MNSAKVLTAHQAEIWNLKQQGVSQEKIAEKLGITKSTVNYIQRVCRKKLGEILGSDAALKPVPPMERVKALSREIERFLAAGATDQAKLQLVDDRIVRALLYLDDQTLAQASATGLANIISGLNNVAQLWRGKPTSITRFEDMRKLDEFLEEVSAELRRRGGGKAIDVTPEEE